MSGLGYNTLFTDIDEAKAEKEKQKILKEKYEKELKQYNIDVDRYPRRLQAWNNYLMNIEGMSNTQWYANYGPGGLDIPSEPKVPIRPIPPPAASHGGYKKARKAKYSRKARYSKKARY